LCRVLFARAPVLGLCFLINVTCFSSYRERIKAEAAITAKADAEDRKHDRATEEEAVRKKKKSKGKGKATSKVCICRNMYIIKKNIYT